MPERSLFVLLADCLRGRLPIVKGELSYHFTTSGGLLPEQATGYVSCEERKLDLGEALANQAKYRDTAL